MHCKSLPVLHLWALHCGHFLQMMRKMTRRITESVSAPSSLSLWHFSWENLEIKHNSLPLPFQQKHSTLWQSCVEQFQEWSLQGASVSSLGKNWEKKFPNLQLNSLLLGFSCSLVS